LGVDKPENLEVARIVQKRIDSIDFNIIDEDLAVVKLLSVEVCNHIPDSAKWFLYLVSMFWPTSISLGKWEKNVDE